MSREDEVKREMEIEAAKHAQGKCPAEDVNAAFGMAVGKLGKKPLVKKKRINRRAGGYHSSATIAGR